VAYGARLESVLGASPRGFESPILRQADQRKRWLGPRSAAHAMGEISPSYADTCW
jgi:hypothetical protein